MCYADFNDIMPAIHAMDADVISIENSRSGSELLQVFRDFKYDREIGPGVYDVHSERVPPVEEMRDLLLRSAEVIEPHLLWANPDCGLKTRRWEEVIPALKNMVRAAQEARRALAEGGSSSQ
jgi:5-methyltetrahydropteroyltriglutamate--homocysteine methyltransferase